MSALDILNKAGINVADTTKENLETDLNVANTETKSNIININSNLESSLEKKINKANTIVITESTRLACAKAGIVPNAYRNSEFDIARVKQNYIDQSKGIKKNVIVNIDDYIGTISGILNVIRSGKRLRGSYIIGAPNGLGKTSFVNTALMVMYQQRLNTVPYVSLSELAEIRLENEKRIARGLQLNFSNRSNVENITYKNDGGDQDKSKYIDMSYYTDINDNDYYKKPTIITGQFSWSEYMYADILFCFLTEPSSKEIESYTLKTVLDTRASKGLPTIVMTSTSLNPYKNHSILGDLIWSEILSYDKDIKRLDRLEHVSCFRV